MKKNGSRQFTLHGDVDVRAALLCGDAFFNLAQPFITAVPSDINDAKRYAEDNLGEMSAAAVNLALAIEIYLKALIAGSGKSFPNEHLLAVLFKELPPDIKSLAQSEYLEGTSGQSVSDTDDAGILFVEVRRQRSNGQLVTKKLPRGLGALLQRNARNFVAWRYIFSAETKIDQPLTFEYRNMVVAARIFRGFFPDVKPTTLS